MYTYAVEYGNRFDLHTITAEMQKRMDLSPSQPCSAATLSECLSELRDLRSVFQIHWTRMDPWAIAFGFSLTLLALLAFVSYEAGMDGPGILTMAFAGVSMALVPVGFTHIAFVPLAIAFYRLVLAIWMKRGRKAAGLGTVVSTVMIGVLALTASSNSFVIQEATVLTYLLQSLLVFTGLFTVSLGNL